MESSLGQQLKLARTRRGLSLADVAHATRVPQQRLQQLEEDNLAAFGNMAYARSFARIYSSHLGVDVDRWVKALPRPVFAGAHDYRYLTSSFGPWVEPLRKRVRVSIHHPKVMPERRRWHAFMLFGIIAIGSIMLGNQFLSPSKISRSGPDQPHVLTPMPASALQPGVAILPAPVIPSGHPKLVSFANKNSTPRAENVVEPAVKAATSESLDTAAKP
jgi:cytoskeletal protein RodZ